jgi:hypothetical protein
MSEYITKLTPLQKKLTVVALCILLSGVSFYAGMQYKMLQNQNGGRMRSFSDRASGQLRGGGFGQNRPVIGEVVTIDDVSMTVKLDDGSTKIINISPSTRYTRQSEISATDIKSGAKIGVFGLANSDGSVSAQNIQIDPQIRFRDVIQMQK